MSGINIMLDQKHTISKLDHIDSGFVVLVPFDKKCQNVFQIIRKTKRSHKTCSQTKLVPI